jgi:hypothetical protein
MRNNRDGADTAVDIFIDRHADLSAIARETRCPSYDLMPRDSYTARSLPAKTDQETPAR